MFSFLKMLEVFVFRVLIQKEEYSFNSKRFNPLKIIVILVLNIFPFISVYLFIQLSETYSLIEKTCPVLAKEIKNGESKEEILLITPKEKDGAKK